MSAETPPKPLLPDFSTAAARRHRQRRELTDLVTRYLMAFGGISVIGAIVLIAFYLFYVVLPLFQSAELESVASYTVPGSSTHDTLYLAMEEQRELAMRIDTGGNIQFFQTASGEIHSSHDSLSHGKQITAFSSGDPSESILGFALDDGRVQLIEHFYDVSYPDDIRKITPAIRFPLGEEALEIDSDSSGMELLSVQHNDEQTTIAATVGQKFYLVSMSREENMLTEEVDIERTDLQVELNYQPTHLALDIEQRDLYIAGNDGKVRFYNVADKEELTLVDEVEAVGSGIEITALSFLSGGISIMVGDSQGHITQWFPVRDENNDYSLEKIRDFDAQSTAILQIAPEYFRKGFAAIDDAGELTVYHSTAHRVVASQTLTDKALSFAVAPRANAYLIEDENRQMQFWHIHNEHPEVSWQAIWGKVWYESREQPEYIWQSSSASSDFEPKFSLTPLAFGTLKAAFYAMLFAIPMSICGAIYTAYFMSPKMRGFVKPTIEIMEALPTVILGFLAGLWFAPYVEKHMPGMFLLLFLLPLFILLAGYVWYRLPEHLRTAVPEGWEAAMLIPVIMVAIGLSMFLSQPIEAALFGGNMPFWITENLGLDFDQRNSLVVGIAMGFAVIPTIFSISEDAIYSVPKQLTTGSLALGATRWQTMVKVILLTASPGIFSAIMIGMGRAVGETMIVVMATGNTAIMDMNIFQGFRALSANIAVEMPESEVGSTHYRILFLAGLVLFIATFIFNTLAELVRQRLRVKYSTL